MLIEHGAVCAAAGIGNERFLFQRVPFFCILVKGQVLADRMPVHIVMPDIFLFLFQLAPSLCAHVFADGLAILVHADLYATAVFA